MRLMTWFGCMHGLIQDADSKQASARCIKQCFSATAALSRTLIRSMQVLCACWCRREENLSYNQNADTGVCVLQPGRRN